MTRFHALAAMLAIALSATLLAAQGTPTAEALFQQGLMLERAEGNVAQAIVLYERVIADYPQDRRVLPQVIVHLARTYDDRHDPRAAKMWRRLTTDFASTPFAEEARRALAVAPQAEGPFRVRPIDAGLDVLRFSTDGKSAAIRKHATRGDELWVRDIDSGRERKLFGETGRTLERLVWSPDNRRVALTTSPFGGERTQVPGEWAGWDLRVIAADSGQSRTVATGPSGRIVANWSPDGQWLLAALGVGSTTSAVGEGRLIAVATGVSRRLSAVAADGELWSRDSRQVVFQTARDAGGFDFWITAVDGTDVRPWKPSLDPSRGPINLAVGVTTHWTTDNRLLVRQVTPGGNSFYLVPVGGGAAEESCTSVPRKWQCLPAMTADGRVRLAMDVEAKRLMLQESGNPGASRRVTTGSASEVSPSLSPDGRLLSFVSNADGKWALHVLPIDRAPSSSVRVASLERDDFDAVSWTADGRLVGDVFIEDADVYRINMDTFGRPVGPPGRLTHDTRWNYAPVVSPAGDLVAYSNDNGLAVMTVDGAAERPVLAGPTQQGLQWRSADEVLFQRSPEPGIAFTSSISALNTKTGVVRTFLELPAGRSAWQYLPTRDEVFYVTFGAGRGQPAPGSRQVLHAKSVATGTVRVVAELADLRAGEATFRVSPDGSRVAYSRQAGSGTARFSELHLMSIDGRDDRVIAARGTPYDWSSDGRFLLHSGIDKGAIYVMVTDTRTGQAWPIPEAMDTDDVAWFDARWSPSGSFIVLSRDGWHDEHRVFDGVTYDAVVKQIQAGRQ